MYRPKYPGNNEFAFTIVDDTDDATLENIRPIYEMLTELGIRITKTVWPLPFKGDSIFRFAETLADKAYTRFLKTLAEHDFEITWHCARMESSNRPEIEEGLERFKDTFGHYPRIHINHGHNLDNLYWGYHRLDNQFLKLLYKFQSGSKSESEGHVQNSPHYWGDLCRRHVLYTRNFSYRSLNVLRINPTLPYRDPIRPCSPYWFSTADAPTVVEFRKRVTKRALDRLRAQNGVCLLSTHLGKGFCRNGVVDPHVRDIFQNLANMPGWYAPAGEILDHLREEQKGSYLLPFFERQSMQWRWALDKVFNA